MVEKAKGNNNPVPLNDNEINELKNLKKKVEYYKDHLDCVDDYHSDKSDNEDSEEEEVQPKKKNIKVQRAAVSAEAYGQWNKKGDFKPKIVPKS